MFVISCFWFRVSVTGFLFSENFPGSLLKHETNMPLEIILKEAAQKMNEKFSSMRVSHGMRVP